MKPCLNKIREKIANGGIATGYAITTAAPLMCEMVGLCGYDFVWIEGEHGPIGREQMAIMMMAANAGGAAAFIRVANYEASNLRQVLDMGPEGIVFPLINNADDAKRAIAACTYPPDGVRGFWPQRASYYGNISLDDYYVNYKDYMWKIMIIETVEGSEHIEEIVQVPGVDAIVIGTGDLTIDMGLGTQFAHPDVMASAERSAAVCRKYNKPILYFTNGSLNDMKHWIKLGAKLFSFGFDLMEMSKILRGNLPILDHAITEIKKEISG